MIDRVAVLDGCQAGKSNRDIAKALGCKTDSVSKIRREFVASGRLDAAEHSHPNPFLRPERTDPPVDVVDDDDDDDDGLDEIEAIDDVDDVLDLQPAVTSSVVHGAKERTAERILAVREKKAELELAQLEKQLIELQNPVVEPVPTTDNTSMLGLLMSQLAAERAQSQVMMGHLLNLAKQPAAPAEASTGGMTEMGKVFGTVADFLDSRGGPEPSDPLSGLIGMATKQLEHRNQAVAAAGHRPVGFSASPPEVAQGQPPAAPAALSIEDETRRRASGWVQFAQKEMLMETDPTSSADVLHPALGHLPGPLRQAILEQPIEALVATLGNYIPDGQVKELVGHIRGNEKHAGWMGRLLAEIREMEASESKPAQEETDNGRPEE